MINLEEHLLICFLSGLILGIGAMIGVFVINAYEDYIATEHNKRKRGYKKWKC